MQKPILTNVIGVGQLELTSVLDLEFIASKMEGSRLNAKKFSGLIIRKTKPKGTILLFRSGKFLLVGSQKEQDCEILSRKLARDMQKIHSNSKITLKAFRISNMVASGNLGYYVNISRVAQLPNAFKDDKSSGVFIRMGKVKCAVVFESGKVILNGASKFIDIEETFEKLVKDLETFEYKNEEVRKKLNKQEIKSKRRKRQQKNKQQQQKQPIVSPYEELQVPSKELEKEEENSNTRANFDYTKLRQSKKERQDDFSPYCSDQISNDDL